MAQAAHSTRLQSGDDIERTCAFIDYLFPHPRSFVVNLWDGTLLPAETESVDFTLLLNSPGSLRRMFAVPIELKIGEAYISGDFDIQGDKMAVVRALLVAARSGFFLTVGQVTPFSRYGLSRLLTLARLWLALPRGTVASQRPLTRSPARLLGKAHTRERDRDAIPYHYNAGNDFYALFLGKQMVYSGAYFQTGTEDIDSAQSSKLEYLCRKLRLKPDERLLDIGCGWGALLLHAAQHYGVTALGVTLSKEQAELANRRVIEAGLQDSVTIKLMDYRDVTGETFDKIVSVGMFEHVGRNALPDYFRQAFRLLKPGGLFLNQGSSACGAWEIGGWDGLVARFIFGRWLFGQRYVFPDGEVLPVSASNLMAEQAGFEVRDVESIREHFVLTLRLWISRLEEHKSEAIQIAGDVTYRIWQLYLAAALVGFQSGTVNEYQSLLGKPLEGQSGLPLTRVDLYT